MSEYGCLHFSTTTFLHPTHAHLLSLIPPPLAPSMGPSYIFIYVPFPYIQPMSITSADMIFDSCIQYKSIHVCALVWSFFKIQPKVSGSQSPGVR